MHVTKWLILSIAASLLVLAACNDDGANGSVATDAPAATDVAVDMRTGEPPDGARLPARRARRVRRQEPGGRGRRRASARHARSALAATIDARPPSR